MYEFNYQRPSDVASAVAARQGNEDALFLAGGMTLLPTLKLRLAQPAELIDLAAIPDLVGAHQEGDVIKVGAMTCHDEVARSATVRQAIPALSTLAGSIGDPQVRNRGTLGGSIANSDPAADYPAALVGLGATVETNQRQIAADDFFTGMFETALEPGELITGVTFPIPVRAGYAKFANPASRYAIVGVMVAETGGTVRVAVTGAGPAVFRQADMEQALAADFSAEAVAGISVPADDLNEDLHASAEYRAHLISVMARRAVAAARG
jgi:carbon-monoxide dehydrogenase medium subunit